MNFPPVKPGREIVRDMINFELGSNYLQNQITIGAPEANNSSGRNTRARVTLPSQGASEIVFALYNRLALQDLFQMPYDIRYDDTLVSLSDVLPRIFADRNIHIDADDVDIVPLNIAPNTATFPVSFNVAAKATSLSYTGQFTIRVQAPLAQPPEEDDMHYRAYPTDVQFNMNAETLAEVIFGEVSSCGSPTKCVSSHPTEDEILTISDYRDITLLEAYLYRQVGVEAVEIFDTSRFDLFPSNASSRAYSHPTDRLLLTELHLFEIQPERHVLRPTVPVVLRSGEEYQVIAKYSHPNFTRPIYFYQRILPW